MKKNGFTLVELIAVLVILSILAMMATPNIIHLMQNGKEKSFISDAEEMISTATYMYKIQNSRGFDDEIFQSVGTNSHQINMSKLTGTIPEKDPYGYKYIKEASNITFNYWRKENNYSLF